MFIIEEKARLGDEVRKEEGVVLSGQRRRCRVEKKKEEEGVVWMAVGKSRRFIMPN